MVGRTFRQPRFRRGAVMIEAAVGFTMLVVLMFGVIEMSLFFQDHEILYNITREAARRMAVGDTGANAKSYALNWASAANSNLNANTVAFTVEQSTDGSNSNWTAISDSSQAKLGDLVRVRSSYTHNNVTSFFGTSYILHATSVIMRVESGSSN